MTKRWLILLALLALPSLASAQLSARRAENFTAVANGTPIRLVGSGTSYHKLTWNKVGTVTVCSVKVQQSATGAFAGEETDLITTQDCSVNGASSIVNATPNWIRIQTHTTYTGTGTVTAVYTGYLNNPTGGGGTGCDTTGATIGQPLTADGLGGCDSTETLEGNLLLNGTGVGDSLTLTGPLSLCKGDNEFCLHANQTTLSAQRDLVLPDADVTLPSTTGAADGDYPSFSSGLLVPTTPGVEARTDADGTAALLSTDRARRVIVTNATSNAVSIAQAGGAGFEAGYITRLLCAIGAGTCTLTPTTSTVNGNLTLVLNQGEEAIVVSDGTNYSAAVGRNFFQMSFNIRGAAGSTLEDTDDDPGMWIAKFPMTIVEICGKVTEGTGTSIVNVQRNDGSAASIAASNITAATTEACTSTFTAGENIISTGHQLDFLMVTGAASGAPTKLTITISYLRR